MFLGSYVSTCFRANTDSVCLCYTCFWAQKRSKEFECHPWLHNFPGPSFCLKYFGLLPWIPLSSFPSVSPLPLWRESCKSEIIFLDFAPLGSWLRSPTTVKLPQIQTHQIISQDAMPRALEAQGYLISDVRLSPAERLSYFPPFHFFLCT